MNPSTIYSNAIRAINALNVNKLEAFELLEKIRDDAAEAMRQQSAKKDGVKTRYQALNNILKNAKKCNPTRPVLWGAWRANNKQYICDAFSLIELNSPLDLIEIAPGLEPINAARIMTDNDGGAPLALPSADDLTLYIKAEKIRLKSAGEPRAVPLWDFGDGLPAVNAQYLLNIIEIFPDAAATASRDAAQMRAISFKSADGRAILLPVKKGAK